MRERRPDEILRVFLAELDKHIEELANGQAESAFEINDVAAIMNIQPGHLSNTISKMTGKSPCDIFEEKLLAIAKKMLQDRSRSIADIARTLTYDPSNFTKFFKQYEGITPRHYRQTLANTN